MKKKQKDNTENDKDEWVYLTIQIYLLEQQFQQFFQRVFNGKMKK